MDQQQIRFNFLDEAQECLHQVESVLLELSSKIAEPENLDLALRATHSVKGGAGMMGFLPLSNVAHRLEDFFKILRIRHHSTQITTEIESLLLLVVDAMAYIIESHRQGLEIRETWLKDRVEPLFDELSKHLGELQLEDENLLFAQREETNVELLMFEEGVEPILDEFEAKLKELPPDELSSALIMTSEKLLVFARMANLETFVTLCESIEEQAIITSPKNINFLIDEALKIWRRSYALVLRGSFDKIHLVLDENLLLSDDTLEFDNFKLPEQNEELLSPNLDLPSNDDLAFLEQISESDLDLLSEENLELENLEDLQNTFANISVFEPEKPLISPPKNTPIFAKTPQTVRVPVEQLSQFNTLFGKLILERNRVNLRLEQLRNFVQLMERRINQLEDSNTRLNNLYDQSSTQDSVPVAEQFISSISLANTGIKSSAKITNRDNFLRQFDTLEMDSYSDLHLISGEQIETIVQLKEVTTDIDLGLEELNQAVRELNNTMGSLQKNANGIQMRPFGDLVKSFPRLIRDLNLKFKKKVNLNIEGETTLLDRTLMESLNAPLMHLIRNAFDHGIEPPKTRETRGKNPQGTITVSAYNRGTQTIIQVKDDGGGIAFDKICNRLKQMGITHGKIEQMSESEILDYIFQPGFTTSEEVTELSGRGVGMDVVRTNLQEIRGTIEVETKVEKGSIFTITIPSNLSILRVMLVETKTMMFAVPVDTVREVVALSKEKKSYGKEIKELIWQNQTIPIIHLENIFTFNRPSRNFEMLGNPIIKQPTILVVGNKENIAGIYLERFWGEQEVTIRPIDSSFPLPKSLISSLILGDGRVLPLIDPFKIVQELSQNPHQKTDLLPVSVDNNKENTLTKVNTILIVDDSINVRLYLAKTLENAGYRVEQAKNGQEAVDKLFNGLNVEAVICDIEMPLLDGYGVLEEVKAKPQFQSLPIMMLSSRSNEKHRKLALNLGACAYFSKPYNEQELLSKIKDFILH
ncbi:MAG: hybrid sensor histidine kinase/response regulator [Cyanobacteria bacterium]|nr:hybrid sensor histidine kinase/response regulator [Cyanobacteria bacterium CG_2015-16_32_12]NCO76840.1 hybrid sensor histidine kinase/response regulator [Cyanobacteria bacterium CG_2015-22_32_23]NCQ04439.1 hybrid sensor histidine kinase/response regulator [Cyanobacteria bacterium CG_2015-09_32_10]NCS84489.1 hybrid sensor histidine kinase/response regulator [Cyanobacteria bacterium CG_2015-02_32_10]